MAVIRKITRFRPKEILDAINQLIDAVSRLEPRASRGTLISQSGKGVTTKASTATQRTQITQAPSDDRPARWQ